ncbi:hypothetical protein S40288_03611 [Stachybotrys chartarum IBT 40288]|nr:hypothetical protein S40288_03611 [Stachybotrys chartarum IBT 40288]
MPQDPNLYGQRPSKKARRDAALPSSLDFTAQLTSLMSNSSRPGPAVGKTRAPKQSKEDVFNNKPSKRERKEDDKKLSLKEVHGTEEETQQLERSRRRMEDKARRYAAMKRGDYVPQENEAAPLVDFDRKWAETAEKEDYSDNTSDDEDEDDGEMVEYEDEFGRLRRGTKADMERMQRQARRGLLGAEELERMSARPAAPTKLIYDDTVQSMAFNPEDADKMEELARKRDRSATPPEQRHYDADWEIRTKGTGFYKFSKDEATRSQEMEALEEERRKTEQQRQAREAQKEARRKEIEQRRQDMAARRAKRQADSFLEGTSTGEGNGGGTQKRDALMGWPPIVVVAGPQTAAYHVVLAGTDHIRRRAPDGQALPGVRICTLGERQGLVIFIDQSIRGVQQTTHGAVFVPKRSVAAFSSCRTACLVISAALGLDLDQPTERVPVPVPVPVPSHVCPSETRSFEATLLPPPPPPPARMLRRMQDPTYTHACVAECAVGNCMRGLGHGCANRASSVWLHWPSPMKPQGSGLGSMEGLAPTELLGLNGLARAVASPATLVLHSKTVPPKQALLHASRPPSRITGPARPKAVGAKKCDSQPGPHRHRKGALDTSGRRAQGFFFFFAGGDINRKWASGTWRCLFSSSSATTATISGLDFPVFTTDPQSSWLPNSAQNLPAPSAHQNTPENTQQDFVLFDSPQPRPHPNSSALLSTSQRRHSSHHNHRQQYPTSSNTVHNHRVAQLLKAIGHPALSTVNANRVANNNHLYSPSSAPLSAAALNQHSRPSRPPVPLFSQSTGNVPQTAKMMNAADVDLDDFTYEGGASTAFSSPAIPTVFDFGSAPSSNMGTVSPQDLLLQEPFMSAPNSSALTALTSPSIYNESPEFDGFNVSPNFGSADFDGSADAWYPLFPQSEESKPVEPRMEDSPALTCDEIDSADRSPVEGDRRKSGTSPSGGVRHSSVAGVNARKRDKPLPPIIVEDPGDVVAMKRARNTLAARKSRERKAQRFEELEERIAKLEEERDHWKKIALAQSGAQ